MKNTIAENWSPSHQAVIQEVDEAVDESYWSLVMHSRDHQQTKRIEAFLKDQQIGFNRTL